MHDVNEKETVARLQFPGKFGYEPLDKEIKLFQQFCHFLSNKL